MRTFMVMLLLALPWSVTACGDDDDNDDPPEPECGNSVLETGETCDGSELAGADCLTMGWHLGTLGCTAECEYDVSGCVGGGPDCGNWVVEWGEECDTTDLGGAVCESIGFSPGELACRADCTFDPSGCGAPASCGNHVIDGAPGVEECDGPDLGGLSCEGLGHLGGALACGINCVIDESTCTDAECGNGVAEGDEQCDGGDFRGEDCVMFGHVGGDLLCDQHCLVDDSQCTD